MKRISLLLVVALIISAAFVACSREEKKTYNESLKETGKNYTVNEADIGKGYKIDNIVDLSFYSRVPKKL